MVRNTVCSSRGPGFNSQDLQGSSQLSIIPVLENQIPSSSLSDITWYKHAYRQNIHTHTHNRNMILTGHVLQMGKSKLSDISKSRKVKYPIFIRMYI